MGLGYDDRDEAILWEMHGIGGLWKSGGME